MRPRTAFAAALLLAVAAPAFAQEAPPSTEPAAPAAKAPPREEAEVDRLCLRETGTMIRPRANKAKGRAGCPSIHSGRVYTQEDLRSTGEIDMADALRKLDTSIR